MQVPGVRRDGHPPAPGCNITDGPGENKGGEQRQKKNRKESYRQRFPLGQVLLTTVRAILLGEQSTEGVRAA
jgi:hypothetical protein